MMKFDRKEAANHIIFIMGASQIAKQLAESVLAEPEWTQNIPTESGCYWSWNGDVDSCPVHVFVSKSGGAPYTTFVMCGQLGLTEAVDCDKWGGWWKRIDMPDLPDGRLSNQTPTDNMNHLISSVATVPAILAEKAGQ